MKKSTHYSVQYILEPLIQACRWVHLNTDLLLISLYVSMVKEVNQCGEYESKQCNCNVKIVNYLTLVFGLSQLWKYGS